MTLCREVYGADLVTDASLYWGMGTREETMAFYDHLDPSIGVRVKACLERGSVVGVKVCYPVINYHIPFKVKKLLLGGNIA